MMPRLVFVALAVAAAAAPGAAQQATTIQEWNVPWANTRPRDPYLDRQGRVWFVGQVGDYVGVLDPRTGDFKKFDLAPRTGPHNLILDSTGIVWYSGNASAHIGRLDPKDGSIRKFPMPDSAARVVVQSTREDFATSEDEVAQADIAEVDAHDRYRQAVDLASTRH